MIRTNTRLSIIWLQLISACPQIVVIAIVIDHNINIPVYGSAQYLRQRQEIAGNGLKTMMSQFHSVQQRSEKQTK